MYKRSERGTIVSGVFSFLLNLLLFLFVMGTMEMAVRVTQLNRVLLQAAYAVKITASANYAIAYSPPTFKQLKLSPDKTAQTSQDNWYKYGESGWDSVPGRTALNILLGSLSKSFDRIEFPPRYNSHDKSSTFNPAMHSFEVKLENVEPGTGSATVVGASGTISGTLGIAGASQAIKGFETKLNGATKPFLFNIIGKLIGISSSKSVLIRASARLQEVAFADFSNPRPDLSWPRISPGGIIADGLAVYADVDLLKNPGEEGAPKPGKGIGIGL